jgi:hypothetical protein
MENRRRLRHVRLGVLTLFENIVPVTTALPCEIVFRRFIEKLLPDILANKGLVPDVRECLVCYRESQSYSRGAHHTRNTESWREFIIRTQKTSRPNRV